MKSLLVAAPWWRPTAGNLLAIRGGRPLVGTYPISGAKNAVLPLMVSALLTPHLVTLRNVPANLDVSVLDEMPPGRRPVVTKLASQKRRRCEEQMFACYCQGKAVWFASAA